MNKYKYYNDEATLNIKIKLILILLIIRFQY
jgi:hypothetical protein